MFESVLCRIRVLPNLAMHRKKSLVYTGLTIEIFHSTEKGGRHLVMLSLTEAMVYMEAHPNAFLQISEEVETPRGEPGANLRPDRGGASILLKTGRDGRGHEVQSSSVIPRRRWSEEVIDFSEVPFVDPGGRWPMRTEEVPYGME